MYIVELNKLMVGLDERNIPYVFKSMDEFNGYQVLCDGWDAVCHKYSYGHEGGYLEVYGNIMEEYGEVLGHLTAQTILDALDEGYKFPTNFFTEHENSDE